MIKQTVQGENRNSTFSSILKGIIVSYIVTIPILIIFSIILTYIDFPEKLINPVVIVTTIISILIAGIVVTKSAKCKGWLSGGLVGFIYMFILYVLGSIVFKNFKIDRYVITMLIIGVLTGCIGGILGINMRAKSYKKIRHRGYRK